MDIRYLLPHLHYYWSVAKNKSFSKAAEEIHVSPSAVSYQIKSLEDKLNMVLISRENGQKPELTPKGEKIAKECFRIFNYLHDILEETLIDEKMPVLSITAPPSHGSTVLVPALSFIKSRLEHINFEIRLTTNILNIDIENIDIAIRNIPPTSDIVGEKLMRVRLKMLASKHYLEHAPSLNSLSDLQKHKIVSFDYQLDDWGRIKKMYPETQLPTKENIMIVNNNSGILEAVKGDFGIAVIPEYVTNGADTSTVVELFPEILHPDAYDLMDTLYICTPRLAHKQRLTTLFTKLFKEYLIENNHSVFV